MIKSKKLNRKVTDKEKNILIRNLFIKIAKRLPEMINFINKETVRIGDTLEINYKVNIEK